jgi:uncharacterized membrane protein YciS (DUF1049 family)
MPVYLSIAYVIFVTFPLALAVSLYVQQRRVKRQIKQLEDKSESPS